MKKILVALLISIPSITFSQVTEKKNTAYVQFWGTGLILSANFERQLSKNTGLNAHLGIGLGGTIPAIPIGFNYLLNLKNRKSFLETGFGIVLTDKGILDDDLPLQTQQGSLGVAYVPSVGYRYQAKKGFMLKVLYSPVFTEYSTEWAFYGIGFGWRF